MIRLASEVGSKESKGIHLLVNNGMISEILHLVIAQITAAGIAKDDNTRFSKAGKPDFSNAQSISDHLSKCISEPLLPRFEASIAHVIAVFSPRRAQCFHLQA